VWAGAVAKYLFRPRARCSSPKRTPRRCRNRKRTALQLELELKQTQGQRHDAVATGRERLGRCTTGQSEYIRLSPYNGKLALAAIYLRRVRVAGHRIAAGAPPLTHVCTVGACGTRPRRGPPAALPGQTCGGILGAMVRIALPQGVGARFIVDFSIIFEKRIRA